VKGGTISSSSEVNQEFFVSLSLIRTLKENCLDILDY
jgi:hypothetical protein